MAVRINTEGFVPEYTTSSIEYHPLTDNIAYGKPRDYSGSFFRASQVCGKTRYRSEDEPRLSVKTIETLTVEDQDAEARRWTAPVEKAAGVLVSMWQHRVQKSKIYGLETHTLCALEHLERACEDGARIVEAHHRAESLQIVDDIEFATRRLRRILEE